MPWTKATGQEFWAAVNEACTIAQQEEHLLLCWIDLILSLYLSWLMIYMSKLTDIGPVSITTDPKKFQQDLQELFVQVGREYGCYL